MELRRQGKPQARSADRARPAVPATSRECDFVKLGLLPEAEGGRMAALKFGSMTSVVLAVVCAAPAPLPVDAQTRPETNGDQSPAISAGRDATVNIHGTSPAQLAEIVRAVSEGATAPLARQIEDLRG